MTRAFHASPPRAGVAFVLALLAGCVRAGFAPGDGDGRAIPDRSLSETRAESRHPDGARDGLAKDGPASDGAAHDGGAVTFSWSKRFGAASVEFGDGVAVDAGGNVFVTGAFSGTVDFGGGPLPSAGSSDIFVASYDPTGAHRWSQRFGAASVDFGNGVAVDAGGNVFVTGAFSGTVGFGGGPPLTSAGEYDIFVASYGPTGAHHWSKSFGAASFDSGDGVAVDGSGNVFVTGQFKGTLDFGGGPLTSAGIVDIFVTSYDPTGAHRWSRRAGGAEGDVGHGVAADGNAFVTGQFAGTVDFGGGPLASGGGADSFVTSYGPTGSHRWSKRLGGTSSDSGGDVAVDKSGNTFVLGYFFGTADLGDGPMASLGGSDIFVVSYDATGARRWSKRLGGTGDDSGGGIAVDRNGNVFVTGAFSETVDFGGGPLMSAGGSDIFVASYGSTGAHRWSKRFGAANFDSGDGVTVDGSGNIIVTGQFQGTVDFGGGPLTSAGGSDIFLLRLSP